MPTMAQASVYSAVRHYLRAIEAAGTDEAKAVMAKMREMPVNDFYVKNGHVREDGRLVHDMYFAQVKTPAESTKPWDYYKILGGHPRRSGVPPAGGGRLPAGHAALRLSFRGRCEASNPEFRDSRGAIAHLRSGPSDHPGNDR